MKLPGVQKKIPRVRINAGRKSAEISEASPSTISVRALELSNNSRYNKHVLELAIKILEKREKKERAENEPMNIDNWPSKDIKYHEIKKHSNESALALALELKLSKNAYVELAKDTKNRGCHIFPGWNCLNKTKEECRPEDYKISEVRLYLHIERLKTNFKPTLSSRDNKNELKNYLTFFFK